MKNSKILKMYAPRNFFSDLYYHLMNMSWPKFLSLFLFAFILLNLLFACAYYFIDGTTTGDGTFLHSFFFSVHTLSTVGYGNISPNGIVGNLISSIEIFTGMLSLAVMTGLIFSKFSIPKAKILFSNNILVTDYNGTPHLMLRIANVRSNRIMNASIGITLMRTETSPEGISLRKMHNLHLVRSETPFFALTLTVMHPITSSSPLYGLSHEELTQTSMGLMASFTGLDETIGQTVSTTNFYRQSDIVLNKEFVDILEDDPKKGTTIRYDKFHNYQ